MSNKNDMMTIKEFADSLNLPKNKINYQVSKLDTNYIVRLNGIKYLKKEAQSLIKEALDIEKPSNLNSKLNVDLNSFEHFFKHLESQLEEKDFQIKKLQMLLDQQQQLTLQSNKQIDKLQLQLEMKEEVHNSEEVDINNFQEQLEQLKRELEQKELDNKRLKGTVEELTHPPKKSFWQRLFNQ